MGNSSNKSANFVFLFDRLRQILCISSKDSGFLWFFKFFLCFSCIGLLASCASPPEYRASNSNTYTSPAARLQAVSWSSLPGWQEDDLTQVWPVWQKSCQGLMKRNSNNLDWRAVCQAISKVDGRDDLAIRRYFESHMKVMEISHASGPSAGSSLGLITGYYEPYLRGSRQRGGVYQTPIHRYPEAWKKRKPDEMPTRAQLLSSGQLNGQELLWVDDPVAAAFMHIQGSGRVKMDDGRVVRLGFAGTNDQKFQSFAQWLLDRKEITRANATMQGIQSWAKKNPGRTQEMLNANPRYVFFRELPFNDDPNSGPLGALGVPLTAERSIAIDTKALPLGAPVYLASTYPLTDKPLRRLMVAQDTGAAIVGAVRADFYWGTGDRAGENAGRMKQQGRMWLLLPR
jgi:membrane-bound lytic murein transglycosylase A